MIKVYTEEEYQERFNNSTWALDDPKAQLWGCEGCRLKGARGKRDGKYKWVGFKEELVNDCCPNCTSEDVFPYFQPIMINYNDEFFKINNNDFDDLDDWV